jgi:hypothetical protein
MTTESASAAPPAENLSVLRTLAPALRNLERNLRTWLDGSHRYPLSLIQRSALEGVVADLRRKAESLDVDRPLLVVMLMGGTGVGKSTLLNALGGGNIAAAAFTRPTTRDPVVYYHESVRPDRLDPALRHCRLVPHDRPVLMDKVIVDTPDLDSTELSNRDKLVRVLPVADVVLYVGSQEKYHDKLGWDLFRQQRKRRAFAFVMNKWDRCLHGLGTGRRPDEDMLHDLEQEGFQSPLLFRTCAQIWVDKALRRQSAPAHPVAIPVTADNGASKSESSVTSEEPQVPEGEQFLDLVHWLEQGLTRLEIEAIKARGVTQLLVHTEQALKDAAPPELGDVAARTRAAWGKPLAEEAAAAGDVLLNSLEPYQKEIEHHFALEGQRRFRGLMGGYLQLVTRLKYTGSALADRVPFVTKSRQEDAPAPWDLAMFTRASSEVAANRELDARTKALINRLLIEGDAQGYPMALLTEPLEALATLDWRQRYAEALAEVLQEVEKHWTRPKGFRRFVKGMILFLSDWVPPLALLAALANLLARFFNLWGANPPPDVRPVDVFLPLIVLLAVLVMLHLLIVLLLPLRWPAIRGEFHAQLEARLRKDLDAVYSPVPTDLADALREERKVVEKLIAETHEVATWLEKREQSASITGLYGR